MTYEITSEMIPIPPADPGGRPKLNVKLVALIDGAAKATELGVTDAARSIYAEYYEGRERVAKTTAEGRIKYLAEKIRSRRRGLMALSTLHAD